MKEIRTLLGMNVVTTMVPDSNHFIVALFFRFSENVLCAMRI